MLGTGTAGLLATYAIAAVMLVVNFLLGLWWNKHLPSTVKEEGWTTRVVAKIAIRPKSTPIIVCLALYGVLEKDVFLSSI